MNIGFYITGIHFEHPWWLMALLVVPLWLMASRYLRKELYPSIRFPDLSTAENAMRSNKRVWPGIVRFATYASFTMLVFAISRPQLPASPSSTQTEGIDIILAMDISISMLARDFTPDRLEASKDVAARFINERGPDRIGLVVFAGQTFTLCPLTNDKAALITLLQQGQAGFIEDGSTSIGDGMATAINRLRDSEARSRVIILLTDGENNSGNIEPLQAAEIAALFGIRIYTIGVGSQGTAIGPVQIVGGSLLFGPVEVNIDEKTLRKAAEITGGRYFRAEDEQALADIYREIDQMEKSLLEFTSNTIRTELYPLLIMVAMSLMAAGWLIRFLFIKTIP